MKRLFAFQSVLAVPLLFFVAVYGARVFEKHFRTRVQLGGQASTTLKKRTLAYVRDLRGRVSLTYFVSARSAMPSSMASVENAVRAFLEELKRAAPARIDYRVLDPGLDAENGSSYASASGASPIKVRKVLRDESSEETVWSSLSLAHDQHRDALIQGITAADLPYLEDWVVESLKAAEQPIQPVVAISSPRRGFSSLPGLVMSNSAAQQRGAPQARVLDLDLDSDPRIPPEADWLLWIEPRNVTHEHVVELQRFLRSGRSALVAGSTYRVDYLPQAGGTFRYRTPLVPCDWKTLLQPFGLSFAQSLVLDKNHDAISWKQPEGSLLKVDAPFHVRILPSLFNTKSLLGPNAGALLASAISPIVMDPMSPGASEWTPEVVATTSEHARVLDLPAGEFDGALFEEAYPVPKQPWLVLLKPASEWHGELLVVGSSTLFHDDPYAQGGNANLGFFRTLLRTYTDSPRLARIRVPRPEPPRVPQLPLASRVAWRVATVFVVPVALLVLALRSARVRRPRTARRPVVLHVCLGLAGFAALVVVARVWNAGWDPSVDLTEDSVHTPPPLTSRLLDRVRQGLEIELLISDSLYMPASLKRLEPQIVARLRSLGFRPKITRPEDLPPQEQARLKASGIEPFALETVENDAAVTARVWSALRLRRGDKVETIPQLDPRAVEDLEFLLALAADRLGGGRRPRVGVLSDLPRLSPAEAHADYQERGYTAPVGSDVYSFVKRLLAQRGYDVVYINPDEPVFPPQMDVIVWLQPRYAWKVSPQFAKFLSEGGAAIVALQHYNVQQRQYRGTGFKTVYWPQPQFHSFNDYLELIGVRQIGDKVADRPGEVLFDRNHADLVLDTQVNRSAFREYDRQQVSKPFLIRAAGDGLSRGSVMTSRLSDLLFIWGSRFVLDEPLLGQRGIVPTVLVRTSPRCWSYDWSGGWIPEESYIEPEAPSLGSQPLAVLLEGPFPAMELKKAEGAGRDTLTVLDSAGASPRAGKLFLIGCSEMFKNSHLYAQRFQHDQLLLNAVALFAHGEEIAEVQARRKVARRFPFQPEGVKVWWRILAVGLAPAAFLALSFLWSLYRRRPMLGHGR